MSTVYIVEDDASVRDSTALVVRLLGFDTVEFRSGEDFLASVTRQWKGCLLIDFNLGTLSAVEVIRKLRAGGIALPIIVTSSESSDVVGPLIGEFQNVEFLEKISRQGDLEAAIRQALTGEGH